MAGPLGVTHMILFSRTETGTNLRITRTPRGPTLHFKVHSYSLSKDVKNHQKAPKESLNDYLNPPLVQIPSRKAADQSSFSMALLLPRTSNLLPN